MHTTVKMVLPKSPAAMTRIVPGDMLRRINGKVISDILDYQYYSYDNNLLIEFSGKDGSVKIVRVRKPEGGDIGLVFESELMDTQHSCANKCIFCFIDQLPKGMRKTLYYKDDDIRLSFLHGNYVTLSNLDDNDIKRIVRLRISPINVSVHTLNPGLREFMLGTNGQPGKEPYRAAAAIRNLEKLAQSGIALNCQIVCCPGINDGKELQKTAEGLIGLGPAINSVSVVPVGLTKHREGLFKLKPFNRKLARETIRLVEAYGRRCLCERKSTLFYCADELYMMAGIKLPRHGFYEDYPQLENGVGMMRLFITEFADALRRCAQTCPVYRHGNKKPHAVSMATGTLAAPYLTKLLQVASKKYDIMPMWTIYPVVNDFFGKSVTVSGLVTGGDIIRQLQGKKLGEQLLIPQNMLRHGEDVFLDDVTLSDLADALGVHIRAVDINGRELCKALLSPLSGGRM